VRGEAPEGPAALGGPVVASWAGQPAAQPGAAAGAAGAGIVAVGLGKSYGKHRVVDGVCLRVGRGEVVGLLGPNGAGKTTTFYLIVGLLGVQEGQILLDGEDLTRLPVHLRARRGIGYLAQEPSIFRKLTVRENVLAVLETMRLEAAERRRRLDALLADLNLTGLADRPGTKLSGGERRRVEIARALVRAPSFLLLDEPFVGIDPIAVAEIQGIVAALRERGLGILITDHSVRETLSITDRAYVMYQGRILVEGTSEQLATDPQARRFYLGEKFSL
jgi:lipopolysaccharide export system ATP-binding protein